MSAKWRDRCSEKERFLANALRRENLQLDRSIRCLNLQYQREMASMSGAQQELRRALDRLSTRQEGRALGRKAGACAAQDRKSEQRKHERYCPNHIVCSKCNLRMRLADSITRQFTPRLWTMYCNSPCGSADDSLTDARLYRIPTFLMHRNLSASDNSLRYLPFISL